VRRILTLLVFMAICGLLSASVAGAGASGPTLQLRKTKIGTILVNARGFTVYAYTADGRNKNVCAAESGCPTIWPAVTSAGAPSLGRGLKSSLVRRIRVRGVGEQLTYAGHPLYTYISDSGPGQTFYVNVFEFRGRWPAINASGQEVK
jgi:predicted lipoprotein with Yx(FWY)xxD motif